MADEPKPESNDSEVTTQPAISTEEAEKTDIVLSPVGDEKVPVETVNNDDPAIQVRDAAKREIDMRVMPWGVVIPTSEGTEEFRRGAFADTDPSRILLMGLEHEVHFGMGQQGQPVLTRHPTGKAVRTWDEADGQYATFKVAGTQRGDEVLALAAEGIVNRVSVEFAEVPGGTLVERRNGRRHKVHTRVKWSGVSTTYRPAYGEQAAVLAVRSQSEGDAPMGEATELAPTNGADTAVLMDFFAKVEARDKARAAIDEKFMERFDQLETRFRQDIVLPGSEPEQKRSTISKGEWVQLVCRMLTGERISDVQMRTFDDVITTDNAGVVPPAFLTELIGVIDASRPFLGSTRRLPTPSSGMKMTVPVINQRPTAAVQSGEKQDVDSTKTLIGTTDFDAITIAGGGDLSLQIIKRSSPDFLNLWLELLAEAYAIESEDQAILALLNSVGGVGSGSLDPEDLSLGDAYVSAFDAIRRPPDTIWLSTEAVGKFIDAKASTSNQPLYPGLSASATAAGGITGVISGLRPVHVPSLDAHGAYAIVGPSSGFAWAEDGTFTLQVDVPSKAGRDVALVGILWPCPWYPAAFTTYHVAS